jgi:hypothetical protein
MSASSIASSCSAKATRLSSIGVDVCSGISSEGMLVGEPMPPRVDTKASVMQPSSVMVRTDSVHLSENGPWPGVSLYAA